MKKVKAMWACLKAKHWDKTAYSYDGGDFMMLGFNSPPLRAFWEKHGTNIRKVFTWLFLLIAGGVVSKFLGLA